MPRASIIIATHNRPDSLPRAVESALAAGTNVEVVVVDDASRDKTAEVCQGLPGIKYVRIERNQRVAGARNVGLVASTGDYVSFLDDDDTRLPGSLDLQTDLLEQNPDAALIYGQAIYTDRDGSITNQAYPTECVQGDVFWKLLTHNFIPCGSAVFKRSAIAALGMLDETIPGIDDWDFWIRLTELYPIIMINQPVVTWRRSHPASSQGTSDAATLVSWSARKFKDTWIKLPRAVAAPREQRRAAWRQFSEKMLEHALWQSAQSVVKGKAIQPIRNLAVAPQLDAGALLRVTRHRLLRQKP